MDGISGETLRGVRGCTHYGFSSLDRMSSKSLVKQSISQIEIFGGKNMIPKTLSKEAKAWWRKIQKEYEISDPGGELLLMTALESFDRMREAQEIIHTEGPVIQDRFKQKKAHPMCSIERDARGQMIQALKSLNLDLEPLSNKPGRP